MRINSKHAIFIISAALLHIEIRFRFLLQKIVFQANDLES